MMTACNWKITAYAWFVGLSVWSGSCYGMLVIG